MENNDLKYVGKRIKREDGFSRATGKVKYTGDMKRKNMLYGRLLLSEHAHANIEIDTKEALKLPGITAVYTYADIPKVPYNSMEWFTGVQGHRDEYLLNPKALYHGDRIALVVGESKGIVEEALSLIKVTYKDLPPVVGVNAARTYETVIKGDTNKCFVKDIGYGDFDEEAGKGIVVETKGTTGKIHHSAIETHVCMTEMDDLGNLLVWTPCQVAFQVRMHVADVNGLPYSKVRVIKAPMGGSFGGKSQPMLEPICAFATLKTGRPVLLYMDRKDAIIGTFQGNAMEIDVKLAITPDGKILGRKFDVAVDGGAYNTNSAAVTNAFAKKIFRLYRMNSQVFHGEAFYTNTTPSGACRAYGSPQAHAVAEVNIDFAAREIGMDPAEFRLKNLVQPGDLDSSGGMPLGNVQIEKCLIKGMDAFDWKTRREKIKEKDDARFKYGVGMACASHVNGYTGAFPDFTNVIIDLNPDGKLKIKIAVHDQGCGTITTLTQIAAETLDVPMEYINMGEADTFVTPYDAAGTQASRVTYSVGSSLKYTCEEFKKELLNKACELYGGEVSDYELKNGELKNIKTNESTSLKKLANDHEKLKSSTISVLRTKGPKTNPASTAAFFCEVKVDTYYGLVEIMDALAVHDIGKMINPTLVEGQIQGGAQFSIGGVISEGVMHNRKGITQNMNFSNYRIMNSVDMPKIRILTVEEGGDEGPFGAKSIGEISAIAPAPAVLNAINFALGTSIADFPCLPERIVSEYLKVKNINNVVEGSEK